MIRNLWLKHWLKLWLITTEQTLLISSLLFTSNHIGIFFAQEGLRLAGPQSWVITRFHKEKRSSRTSKLCIDYCSSISILVTAPIAALTGQSNGTKLLIIPPSCEYLHVSRMNRWNAIWPMFVAEYFPQFWRNWKWLSLKCVRVYSHDQSRVEFHSFSDCCTVDTVRVWEGRELRVLPSSKKHISPSDTHPLAFLDWSLFTPPPPPTICSPPNPYKKCYEKKHINFDNSDLVVGQLIMMSIVKSILLSIFALFSP